MPVLVGALDFGLSPQIAAKQGTPSRVIPFLPQLMAIGDVRCVSEQVVRHGFAGEENGTELIDAQRLTAAESRTRRSDKRPTKGTIRRGITPHGVLVLASPLSYYVATQIAWALTFPDSKSHSFFPRRRFCFASCCWSPLGADRPTCSPPPALIFWRPSRLTGRRFTHLT